MTFFQAEFFRFEVTESPAQSWRRLGLMLRLHLRHLADSLQRAGTSKRAAAALTAAPPVSVFIHFVLWVDAVAGHWHRLSWQISLLVVSGSSHSKLKKQIEEQGGVFFCKYKCADFDLWFKHDKRCRQEIRRKADTKWRCDKVKIRFFLSSEWSLCFTTDLRLIIQQYFSKYKVLSSNDPDSADNHVSYIPSVMSRGNQTQAFYICMDELDKKNTQITKQKLATIFAPPLPVPYKFCFYYYDCWYGKTNTL